jgi:hypothetical protein
LTRLFSDRPPFRLFEIQTGKPVDDRSSVVPARPAVSPSLRDVSPQPVGDIVSERRSGDRRG